MSDPEVAAAVAMWVRYAREDLVAAEAQLNLRSSHEPRHVCFNAQQAAEKALKAIFVARQREFPFTHDLNELADLLEPGDAAASTSAELTWLSRWAMQTRYPFADEADWPDAVAAVREARAVVEAAAEDVGRLA